MTNIEQQVIILHNNKVPLDSIAQQLLISLQEVMDIIFIYKE